MLWRLNKNFFKRRLLNKIVSKLKKKKYQFKK